MAKYFELKNDNQNVVIDDTFNVGKFLYRIDIPPNFTAINQAGKPDGNIWNQLNEMVLLRFSTFREGGFDYDDTDANRNIILARLIVFTQATSSHRAVLTLKRVNNMWELGVQLLSNNNSLTIGLCIYTFAKVLPSKLGLAVYNEQGDLVFDALKGHLQQIGTVSGTVNVRGNPGGSFEFNLPSGMSSSNLYMSCISTKPYYAAYRITGGGVSYSSTYYNPVMEIVSDSKLKVTYWRDNDVAGNNSSSSYDRVWENIIYCPYPKGVYTGWRQ